MRSNLGRSARQISKQDENSLATNSMALFYWQKQMCEMRVCICLFVSESITILFRSGIARDTEADQPLGKPTWSPRGTFYKLLRQDRFGIGLYVHSFRGFKDSLSCHSCIGRCNLSSFHRKKKTNKQTNKNNWVQWHFLPLQVAEFLAKRRDNMFLEFDISISHSVRDTFLSTGNEVAYKVRISLLSPDIHMQILPNALYTFP